MVKFEGLFSIIPSAASTTASTAAFNSARPARCAAAASLFLVLASCSTEVNCENLCERTLACEVTFAPSDDVSGSRIVAGDRSDQESCVLGCAENPVVTAESARCVDAITDADADATTCQAPVAACFNVDLTPEST